jgi:hypothetical protein
MREVINWSIRVWLLFIFLNGAILISLGVALSDSALALLALVLLILTLYFSHTSRLRLIASTQFLSVGKAEIELRFIKEVIPLNESEMKYERGSGLDPRAYLALRFWVKGGMKVLLDDPRDPTPYWLASTRQADEFKKYLGK